MGGQLYLNIVYTKYIYIYILSLNAAVATPSFTLYAIQFRQLTEQVLVDNQIRLIMKPGKEQTFLK